jgi:hypothetical protein
MDAQFLQEAGERSHCKIFKQDQARAHGENII